MNQGFMPTHWLIYNIIAPHRLLYVGVPHGGGSHSWERPYRVSTREPALWVSPNRLPSQTSGEMSSIKYFLLCCCIFLNRPLVFDSIPYDKAQSVLISQHRCVAIFKDKQNKPTGFALGSIEGRVAIHYINPPNPWAKQHTSHENANYSVIHR